MAPTCENNVQIKLTPKNFLQIYQYLGIFVLPETSACDKESKVFYLNSQRNTNFSESFQPDQEKACNICPFQGFNISQKPKSSPLSYFAQKTRLNLAPN